MTAAIATEENRRVGLAIVALALGAAVRAGRARHGAAALMFASTAITAACLFAIAASFGWLLLNEPLGPVQTLGGVLILIGIWIARPRTGQQVEVGL